MFSTPICIDNKVIVPAMAIAIIQIPMFHLSTLDPSRFPTGKRLNAAKKLLIEKPIEHTINMITEVSEVNADG